MRGFLSGLLAFAACVLLGAQAHAQGVHRPVPDIIDNAWSLPTGVAGQFGAGGPTLVFPQSLPAANSTEVRTSVDDFKCVHVGQQVEGGTVCSAADADDTSALNRALAAGTPFRVSRLLVLSAPITYTGCPDIEGAGPSVAALYWTSTTGGGLTINCNDAGGSVTRIRYVTFLAPIANTGPALTVNNSPASGTSAVPPSLDIEGVAIASASNNAGWTSAIVCNNCAGTTIRNSFLSGPSGAYMQACMEFNTTNNYGTTTQPSQTFLVAHNTCQYATYGEWVHGSTGFDFENFHSYGNIITNVTNPIYWDGTNGGGGGGSVSTFYSDQDILQASLTGTGSEMTLKNLSIADIRGLEANHGNTADIISLTGTSHVLIHDVPSLFQFQVASTGAGIHAVGTGNSGLSVQNVIFYGLTALPSGVLLDSGTSYSQIGRNIYSGSVTNQITDNSGSATNTFWSPEAGPLGGLTLSGTINGGAVASAGPFVFHVMAVATILAALPCSTTFQGWEYAVTDSNVNTFNATITGTGTYAGKAYCNGTNWVFR